MRISDWSSDVCSSDLPHVSAVPKVMILAVFGIALAAWLVVGSLAEFAERIKLFRAPAATVWSRAVNLPRSAWGMTIAHAGLGVAVAGIVGLSAWTTEDIRVDRKSTRLNSSH